MQIISQIFAFSRQSIVLILNSYLFFCTPLKAMDQEAPSSLTQNYQKTVQEMHPYCAALVAHTNEQLRITKIKIEMFNPLQHTIFEEGKQICSELPILVTVLNNKLFTLSGLCEHYNVIPQEKEIETHLTKATALFKTLDEYEKSEFKYISTIAQLEKNLFCSFIDQIKSLEEKDEKLKQLELKILHLERQQRAQKTKNSCVEEKENMHVEKAELIEQIESLKAQLKNAQEQITQPALSPIDTQAKTTPLAEHPEHFDKKKYFITGIVSGIFCSALCVLLLFRNNTK